MAYPLHIAPLSWLLNGNSICRIECGEYVQTHEEHDNSMQTCTIGAIALRPTCNEQGAYYFLGLDSGRLPIPDEVIKHVYRMARRARSRRKLQFLNHNILI